MIRKVKALGAAAICVIAAGAVPAAAHSAEFHSTAEHTVLSAGQTKSFVFSAGSGFGSITCSTASFSGTVAAKTTGEWRVDPTFESCKDSFGRTVHAYEACPFLLVTAIYAGPQAELATAGVCGGLVLLAFLITSGEKTTCEMKLSAQTGLSPVSYTNESGKVSVTFSITNLKSTTAGGLFNCGIADGEHASGTITGSSRVSGTDTSGAAATLKVE